MLLAAPSVWVDSLLTELAMAVGEEQIVYLGASLGQAVDTSLRVGVFTDRLLVTAEARGIGDARPVVTTTLHSRRLLERLEITAVSGTAAPGPEWPSRFRLRAVYASGFEVIVPSSVVDTAAKPASVDRVLMGLRTDLSAHD